jgi:hypothetical protein
MVLTPTTLIQVYSWIEYELPHSIPKAQYYNWCEQTLGPEQEIGPDTIRGNWYYIVSGIFFRNEADHTLFLLRWA